MIIIWSCEFWKNLIAVIIGPAFSNPTTWPGWHNLSSFCKEIKRQEIESTVFAFLVLCLECTLYNVISSGLCKIYSTRILTIDEHASLTYECMLFNTTSTLLCVSSSTETIHLFKLSHPGPSSEGSISPLSPNRKELPAPQIKENAQKKERNWKAKVYNKEQTLMSKKNRYLSNPSQSILACRWNQVHYKYHQQCRRSKDHGQLTSTVSLMSLPLPWTDRCWKRRNCHR